MNKGQIRYQFKRKSLRYVILGVELAVKHWIIFFFLRSKVLLLVFNAGKKPLTTTSCVSYASEQMAEGWGALLWHSVHSQNIPAHPGLSRYQQLAFIK